MAFDIYLAGTEKNKILEFILKDCPVPKLYNQVVERATIDKWVAAKRDDGFQGKVFVDSGAYLAYTQGKQLDVDDYINFLNARIDYIDLFAPIDKIPGEHRKEKTKEDILQAPALSWENYLYMRERISQPDKLLPVFHRREDFKWLRTILDARFDGKPIPYIALAPTTDSSTAEKDEWLDRCYEIIGKSSNPDVKTHLFGVTKLELLEMYPCTSADSTTWIRVAAFGNVLTEWGMVNVSDVSKHLDKNIVNAHPVAKETMRAYVAELGFNLDDLCGETEHNIEEGITARDRRIMYNCVYLRRWSENYKFKGIGSYRKPLF